MVRLAVKLGATATPVSAPLGRTPSAIAFRVLGATFAIVGLSNVEHVILKCDPHLIEALKAKYVAVGHRSHLDRRYWISVDLGADIPADVLTGLVDQSYDLVCESLTRKQRANLEALRKSTP